MTPGSSSHEALKKVVIDKVLIKDMEKMNKNINTTYLEVFHSLKIRYIPKTIFFEQKMNKNINTTFLEVFHSLKIRYIPKTIFFEQEKMVSGAKYCLDICYISRKY